jgi:hypothetical protein
MCKDHLQSSLSILFILVAQKAYEDLDYLSRQATTHFSNLLSTPGVAPTT